MIEVITCQFNPQEYSRPVENYNRFRHYMGAFEPFVVVKSIELSFDAQRPKLRDARLYLHGSLKRHCLWQKEALLNRLIQESVCEFVGWFDSDVLLMNPAWVTLTEKFFRDNPNCNVLQPFSFSYWADKYGEIAPIERSLGFQRFNNSPNWYDFTCSHPGLAWVARGSWLRECLLYPKLVSGCADSCMALAWGGQLARATATMNPRLAADFSQWARKSGTQTIGYIPGAAVHLFHGTNEDRGRRKQRDLHADLDPQRDVFFEESGALRWSDEAMEVKTTMVEAVRARFAQRREDA